MNKKSPERLCETLMGAVEFVRDAMTLDDPDAILTCDDEEHTLSKPPVESGFLHNK